MSRAKSDSLPSKENHQPDSLDMRAHVIPLIRFLSSCETPITIGIQGASGCGKSSIMRMIRDKLIESSENHGDRQSGQQVLETMVISSSAWSHSFFPTNNQCLMSLLLDISQQISYGQVLEKDFTSFHEKLRNLISSPEDSGNFVKLAQSNLPTLIESLLATNQSSKIRLVILVDDLERIAPPLAVKMLELLNHIFTIDKCITIVGMDYQVVVSGLVDRFSEMGINQESRLRAEFQRLIQVPFHIPLTSRNLGQYLADLLLKKSFIRPEQLEQFSQILPIVGLSIGSNPRLVKRLAISLELISCNLGKRQNESELDEVMNKSILLFLVCLQISFPRVYDLLVRNPVFSEWDDDFALEAIRGVPLPDDLEQALTSIRRTHEIDFDETWEQALFKILWARNWHRDQVIEISRILSIVKDEVVGSEKISELGIFIKKGLQATAPTSIAVEDNFLDRSLRDSFQENHLQAQVSYWSQLRSKLKDKDTLFKDIPEGHASVYLARKDNNLPANTQFLISLRARPFCRFESICGEPSDNFLMFERLQEYKDLIEEVVGSQVIFSLDKESAIQSVDLIPVDSNYPRRGLIPSFGDKRLVADWIRSQSLMIPRFEKAIRKALEGRVTQEQLNSFRERNSAPMAEEFALEVRTTTGV